MRQQLPAYIKVCCPAGGKMRATEEKKKSFILYDDYKTAFYHLSDENAGKLIKAIFRYNDQRQKENMHEVLEGAYEIITNRMDTDKEKYAEKCERRKENGKAGGRPKGAGITRGDTYIEGDLLDN